MFDDKDICDKIVEYLSEKANHQDQLNGILMGVYDKVFGNFTDILLRNLSDLVTRSIIEEARDEDNNIVYRLPVDPEKLPENLKKRRYDR